MLVPASFCSVGEFSTFLLKVGRLRDLTGVCYFMDVDCAVRSGWVEWDIWLST